MTTTIPHRCHPVPIVICMALLVLIACVPGGKSQETVVAPLSAPCESGAWQSYGVADGLVAIPVQALGLYQKDGSLLATRIFTGS